MSFSSEFCRRRAAHERSIILASWSLSLHLHIDDITTSRYSTPYKQRIRESRLGPRGRPDGWNRYLIEWNPLQLHIAPDMFRSYSHSINSYENRLLTTTKLASSVKFRQGWHIEKGILNRAGEWRRIILNWQRWIEGYQQSDALEYQARYCIGTLACSETDADIFLCRLSILLMLEKT